MITELGVAETTHPEASQPNAYPFKVYSAVLQGGDSRWVLTRQ